MHIIVTDHAGITHRLQAETGWRIMEIIRDWGVSIKAECGGCCLCATCHVYIDEAWVDKLIPPTDDEIERLDDADDVRKNSRLSCQIIMCPELDGLQLTLGAGSEA